MPQTPPRLTIDWQAYLPLLEDSDIPEADKRELIETLWSIVVLFVDLGFETDTTPQSCGKRSVTPTGAPLDLVSLDKLQPRDCSKEAPCQKS